MRGDLHKGFIMEEEKIIKILFSSVLFMTILVGVWFMRPFYIVSPGENALHLRLGKIVDTKKEPGAYLKYPFIDTIVPIDIRIKKSVIKTEAFSQDLQSVDIEVAINHRVQDALSIYCNIGVDYQEIVIDPFTQESVKAIIARFTAENLTQRRHDAKEMVKNDLTESLAAVDIELVDFNFIHADFRSDFINAVEKKQIAEQDAKRTKFITDKVKEEVIQSKVRSEAEAYSLQVQRAAVTPELIELKKVEALFRAIEKWNGILPEFVGASVPFLKVDNK